MSQQSKHELTFALRLLLVSFPVQGKILPNRWLHPCSYQIFSAIAAKEMIMQMCSHENHLNQGSLTRNPKPHVKITTVCGPPGTWPLFGSSVPRSIIALFLKRVFQDMLKPFYHRWNCLSRYLNHTLQNFLSILDLVISKLQALAKRSRYIWGPLYSYSWYFVLLTCWLTDLKNDEWYM